MNFFEEKHPDKRNIQRRILRGGFQGMIRSASMRFTGCTNEYKCL